MKDTIKRTIPTTFIKTASIKLVDGKMTAVPNTDIVIVGKEIAESKAQKIAAAQYPGCAVVAVDYSEQMYEIKPEDFIKYGQPVNTSKDTVTDDMPSEN